MLEKLISHKTKTSFFSKKVVDKKTEFSKGNKDFSEPVASLSHVNMNQFVQFLNENQSIFSSEKYAQVLQKKWDTYCYFLQSGKPPLYLIMYIILAALFILAFSTDAAAEEKSMAERLIEAAKKGDLNTIKQYLKKEEYAAIKDEKGKTLLLIASSYGHLPIVQYLLRNHIAKINESCKTGSTAERYAAANNQLQVLQWLLSKEGGASIDYCLPSACHYGAFDVVKWLLDEKNPDLAQYFNDGNSGILCAAENGHKNIVELLIKKDKSTISHYNNKWLTPLHYAAKNGHLEMVELLVNSGAKINDITLGTLNEGQYTPFLYAVESGHLDIAKYLNKKQADLKKTTYQATNTAFLLAAKNGRTEVMKWLILEKFSTIEEKNHYEDTALLLAIKNGHVGTVEWLLEQNANVQAKNSAGQTAETIILSNSNVQGKIRLMHALKKHELWNCAKQNDAEKVKALLAKYPELATSTDKEGNTLLHLLASNKYSRVSLFGLRGFDFKAKNKAGKTALHIAIENGNEDVFNALLKQSDLDAKDELGNTPLHIACRKGMLGIVSVLLKAHAGIDEKNKNEEAPIDVAAKGGFEPIVRALFTEGAAHLKNVPGIAVKHGHLSIIKFIKEIKDEALLKDVDENGNTLFHLAAQAGYVEIAKELIGFDQVYYLDKPNHHGLLPIHLAAEQGRDEFLQNIFFNRNTNLNEGDKKNNQTPLHLAVRHGRIKTVEMLSANSDVNLEEKDSQNKTPLAYAMEEGNTKIREILNRQITLRNRVKPQSTVKDQKCPIKNVVFQGGGVRGIAYLGALDALVDKGIDLSKIEKVAGASAGALTALILALGFELDTVDKILSQKNLNDFLDKKQLEKNRSAWGLLKDQATKSAFSWLTNAKKPELTEDVNAELFDSFGIYEGEDLRAWIDKLIVDRLKSFGIPHTNLTFKELHDLKEENQHGFKDLYVQGTNLTEKGPRTFSWEATPDVIIADAVRISMSIPIIFKPHKVHVKDQNKQRVLESDDWYVDGGVANNYPLKLFDDNDSLNPETIGFRLISPHKSRTLSTTTKDEAEIKSLFQFLYAVSMVFYNTQEASYTFDRRSILINTMHVAMDDFGIDDDKKELLRLKGKEAVELHVREFGGIGIDSNSTG